MIYYILFIIVAVLALFGLSSNRKVKIFISTIIVVILSLFAGTRSFIDNDYGMYWNIFKVTPDKFSDFRNLSIPLEWSMFFIPNFFRTLFIDNELVVYSCFLTFAFLGVTGKVIAIRKYSVNFFLSIIIYLSYLFFMQEMTTIRAGVASGIFLLLIPHIVKGEHKSFLLKLPFAFFFHSTSLLFFLSWILIRLKIKIKYYYYALAVSLLIALLKIDILTMLFLDRVFPRVKIYMESLSWNNEEGKINLFNFKIVFALIFFAFFAYHYKKLSHYKWFDVLFKIHIISLILFFALSAKAMVFSLRSFEMLSVVQILLLPMATMVFAPKFKLFAWAGVILVALIQLFYMIDVAGIFEPYKSWLL